MAKVNAAEILQTVMAAKAAGVQFSKESNALLERFLARNMAALEAEDAAERRHREEAIQMAKDQIELRKRIRSACNHRKEDGSSALFGQRLVNGQECLICLHCGSDWFDPPNEKLGQIAAPPHLTSNRKFVGMQLNK